MEEIDSYAQLIVVTSLKTKNARGAYFEEIMKPNTKMIFFITVQSQIVHHF